MFFLEIGNQPIADSLIYSRNQILLITRIIRDPMIENQTEGLHHPSYTFVVYQRFGKFVNKKIVVFKS